MNRTIIDGSVSPGYGSPSSIASAVHEGPGWVVVVGGPVVGVLVIGGGVVAGAVVGGVVAGGVVAAVVVGGGVVGGSVDVVAGVVLDVVVDSVVEGMLVCSVDGGVEDRDGVARSPVPQLAAPRAPAVSSASATSDRDITHLF